MTRSMLQLRNVTEAEGAEMSSSGADKNVKVSREAWRLLRLVRAMDDTEMRDLATEAILEYVQHHHPEALEVLPDEEPDEEGNGD